MDNLWKHMMLEPGNVPEEIMKTWEILAQELHQNNQFTNWDHYLSKNTFDFCQVFGKIRLFLWGGIYSSSFCCQQWRARCCEYGSHFYRFSVYRGKR